MISAPDAGSRIGLPTHTGDEKSPLETRSSRAGSLFSVHILACNEYGLLIYQIVRGIIKK